MALDADVPPEPTFGMTATGDGTIQLLSVAFSDLENTRSIIAGTLTLFYWNELNSPSGFALASGVAEQDAVIDLSPAGSAAVGDLVQIEREVLKVTGVQNGGLSYQVARGSHGTTAASHAAATKVYHLEKKVSIAPFSRDFFGSPASGSYAHTVVLPNARVAAAELVVTNLRGNSPAAEKNLTATTDAGLRTLSGGQITLQVDGYLSIEDDATAPLVVDAYASIRDLFAVVNEAPTGAPIELRVRQDTTAICTLTIPVGEIISNVVDGFGLAPLVPGARVSLDILSVGQTADTTPGRDLTVTIRT